MVYESLGKPVILVLNDLKGLQKDFMAVRKSRKVSGFMIYLHLKNSAFKAVKRDAKV